MKKLIVLMTVCVCIIFCQTKTTAQTFTWGLKGGVSTPDIKPDDVNPLKINNIKDSLAIKIKDANYGWQLGLFARLKVSHFYVQPEVLFSSSSSTYNTSSLNTHNIIDSVRNESFRNLDFPVMLGFKFGTLRLNAGPVGHYYLSSTDQLINLSGYSANFSKFTWGYQAGIGLDFGRIGLDLRYEGNFNNYGDYITFGNTTFAFSQKPSRTILNLSFAF